MATLNESPTQPIICPLARDEDGNAIELPSSAYAWRVRRKTGGRPRIVLGVDKQPMQLPLSYSIVDLEDILAPAEYLLDLVDAKGAALSVTVAIAIGSLRNADEGETSEPTDSLAIAANLPTSGSETRLVLEANVRATQMAFLHNQKTLELGLRMAESLRDGVRVMAESQADWIKSISSARGFFRNMPALPPPEPVNNDEDDDDDDDDEEDEPAPVSGPDWVESIAPLVGIVTQQIVQAVMNIGTNKADAPAVAKPKIELRDMFDWRRVAKKREAAEAEAARPALPPTVDLGSMMAKLPPALLAKLVEVRSLLTDDEQHQAMRLFAQLDPEGVEVVIKSGETMTAEQLATFLRNMIAKPAA